MPELPSRHLQSRMGDKSDTDKFNYSHSGFSPIKIKNSKLMHSTLKGSTGRQSSNNDTNKSLASELRAFS